MIDVIKAHIPEGHPNRPGTKLEALKAIVVHYTQNEEEGATDTMNVKYIGRKYTRKEGKSYEADGETRFHFGSAHVFCDVDSITEAIPLDEVAWGCGDKSYKGGYQRIAEKVFRRRQNYQTISVEICNNDTIKHSDKDWQIAVEKAKQWIIEYLIAYNIVVDKEGSLSPQTVNESPVGGSILLLRHYDISGKVCPKPFIYTPEDWKKFVEEIAAQVNDYGA